MFIKIWYFSVPGRLLQPVPVIDHPLAVSKMEANNRIVDKDMDSDSGQDFISNKSQVELDNIQGQVVGSHGACLSLSDHDRLRIFVNEFITHGLASWAERTLRVLNDQVCTLQTFSTF